MITAKELAYMVLRFVNMEGVTDGNGESWDSGDCLENIRKTLVTVARQEGWTE